MFFAVFFGIIVAVLVLRYHKELLAISFDLFRFIAYISLKFIASFLGLITKVIDRIRRFKWYLAIKIIVVAWFSITLVMVFAYWIWKIISGNT
jgi:hypothetical protein